MFNHTPLRALRFPEYVGHNSDAFADSLRDALAAAGPALVVVDAAQLLADEPDQLRTLLAVLDDPATDAEPALRVTLQVVPAEEDELRRRVIAGAA